jgi:hypothetical protein
MSTEFTQMPGDDRCASFACGNRMNATGNGWVLVSMPALPVSAAVTLPALRLSMCSVCATRLSHEVTSEREGS